MKRLLGLLLTCLLLVGLSTTAVAAENMNELYVSSMGADTNPGTQDEPVATLAKAAEIVNQTGDGESCVIYIMSDLTLEASARFFNHHVTICSFGGDGERYTIARGDLLAVGSDPARSEYNPALIEIGGDVTGQAVASLRIENIILDDQGYRMGNCFVQADSEGDGTTLVGGDEIPNTDIVQDAIIAPITALLTYIWARVLFCGTSAECLRCALRAVR